MCKPEKPLVADASFFREKVNGNMNSAKYHGIEYFGMRCVPTEAIYLIHDIALYHAITLKVLEHSKNVKEYPFLND